MPGNVPLLGGRQLCSKGLKAASAGMKQFGLLWVDSTIGYDELALVLSRDDEQVAAALIRRCNLRAYTMEEISLIPMR